MSKQIELALAQFVGFYHGKWNRDDVLELVFSMGLTKKEWAKIKNQDIETYLSESEIKEVDEYFESKKYVESLKKNI